MKTLALAGPEDLDESLLAAAIWLNVSLESTVVIPLATVVIATSIVDLKTGVFGKWVGGVGVVVSILLLVGAAWPLRGSTLSFLGFTMLYGRLLLALWFVSVGISLMKTKAPPWHVPGEGLFDPRQMIEGFKDQDGGR